MADARQDGTLAELAAARDAAENDYLEQVRQLESRVSALLSATADAEKLARDRTPFAEPSSLGMPDLVVAPAGNPRAADQPAWPVGRGIRRITNGIVRWWLRDYLAVLDARHEALAERTRHLEDDARASVDALHESIAAVAASCTELSTALSRVHGEVQAAMGDLDTRHEALREAHSRGSEAMDLLAGVTLRLRTLMNAKDAENFQRAVGGLDMKAEAVLDLLARRQEALLAELVGRRQELDSLIDEVRR